MIGPHRGRAQVKGPGHPEDGHILSTLGHSWGQNAWKGKVKIHMKSSRNGRLPSKSL